MPEFDDATHELRRSAHDQGDRAIAPGQAVETVRRLEREAARRARSTRSDRRWRGRRRAGGRPREGSADARGAAPRPRETATRAGLDFADVIDPTRAVQRLPDDVADRLVPAAAGDPLRDRRRGIGTRNASCTCGSSPTTCWSTPSRTMIGRGRVRQRRSSTGPSAGGRAATGRATGRLGRAGPRSPAPAGRSG